MISQSIKRERERGLHFRSFQVIEKRSRTMVSFHFSYFKSQQRIEYTSLLAQTFQTSKRDHPGIQVFPDDSNISFILTTNHKLSFFWISKRACLSLSEIPARGIKRQQWLEIWNAQAGLSAPAGGYHPSYDKTKTNVLPLAFKDAE